MKIKAIIPGHLDSKRFPRKLLYQIHGIPMIEHVRRRAIMSELVDDVIVATCDEEIADVVKEFGGQVIMTSNTHLNGTSRVSEAVEKIQCSHVMLLQGDEPLLLPRHVNTIANNVRNEPSVKLWNATAALQSAIELNRNSFVKCTTSVSGRILSCFRNSPYNSPFDVQKTFVQKVLGIMVFERNYLLDVAKLPPSPIELSESIEQMRSIENDIAVYSIQVSPALPSVNEPQEVVPILEALEKEKEQETILSHILNNNKSE